MNLHEVLAPPNIPVYRKTVDQETEERAKLNFMNELTAKMANDLDIQIKAGNVTLPIASTTKPAVWRSNRTESVTFAKLNSLFENIININEADQPISITEYIVGLFVNTMKSPIFKNDPELSAKLQELAHKVETTYNLDKGKAAINELVDFGYNSLRALRKPNVRQQSASSTSTPANIPAAPTAPTSNFGINPDGSITISGAKGQAPSKILPGDPLYARFVAYINKELSK